MNLHILGEVLIRGAAVGVLATLLMDGFAILIASRGWIQLSPYGVVPRLLGRWLLRLPSGPIFGYILATPSQDREIPAGWIAHYLIGSTLGAAYSLLAWANDWTGVEIALCFGLATCALPWIILYPALGFGYFAIRTPKCGALLISSTINHLVFGVGLALAGALLRI